MIRYFVPYTGNKPASVQINGHKLLILSKDKTCLEDELESIGADAVKVIKVGGSREEQSRLFNKLAKVNDAGVVIAPGDVGLGQVLEGLKNQLPWLQ